MAVLLYQYACQGDAFTTLFINAPAHGMLVLIASAGSQGSSETALRAFADRIRKEGAYINVQAKI